LIHACELYTHGVDPELIVCLLRICRVNVDEYLEDDLYAYKEDECNVLDYIVRFDIGVRSGVVEASPLVDAKVLPLMLRDVLAYRLLKWLQSCTTSSIQSHVIQTVFTHVKNIDVYLREKSLVMLKNCYTEGRSPKMMLDRHVRVDVTMIQVTDLVRTYIHAR